MMKAPRSKSVRLVALAALATTAVALLQGCESEPKSAGVAAAVFAFPPGCTPPPELTHCKNYQQPSARNDESCEAGKCRTFKVNVIASTSTEICRVDFDYTELRITKAKKDARVVWELFAPSKDYEFATTADRVPSPAGVGLFAPDSSSKKPDDTWRVVAGESSPTKHVVAVVNDKKTEFCHYPRVMGPDLTPSAPRGKKTLCCPIDPMIINEPS